MQNATVDRNSYKYDMQLALCLIMSQNAMQHLYDFACSMIRESAIISSSHEATTFFHERDYQIIASSFIWRLVPYNHIDVLYHVKI